MKIDLWKGLNKMEWISVKDDLPSDRNDVLTYSVLGIVIATYSTMHSASFKTKEWHAQYAGYEVDYPDLSSVQITHWMELPEEPNR